MRYINPRLTLTLALTVSLKKKSILFSNALLFYFLHFQWPRWIVLRDDLFPNTSSGYNILNYSWERFARCLYFLSSSSVLFMSISFLSLALIIYHPSS